MHGHGAHDDMSYVPDEMLAEWQRRDPIEGYAARLVAEFGFAADEVEEIRERVRSYVAECAEQALASPLPDPAIATAGVFAEQWEALGDGAPRGHAGRTGGGGVMADLTYLEAISDALRHRDAARRIGLLHRRGHRRFRPVPSR